MTTQAFSRLTAGSEVVVTGICAERHTSLPLAHGKPEVGLVLLVGELNETGDRAVVYVPGSARAYVVCPDDVETYRG